MPYPAVQEHRMPYDIDGTEIGHSKESSVFSNGIKSWLNPQTKINLNKENKPQTWRTDNTTQLGFWFFFPELREITKISFLFSNSIAPLGSIVIQGSQDTTNGIDGFWETAINSVQDPNINSDFWRNNIFSVSFSSPMKSVRISLSGRYVNSFLDLNAIHLYGRKAAGQTPDDIGFTDINGNELTELLDWGDRPEGTTQIEAVKIKNLSTTKIANAVNLQLNHANFAMSFGESGPWQSVLDIASIGPQSLSSTIYIKCEIPPPLTLLGPVAARIITAVGNWT